MAANRTSAPRRWLAALVLLLALPGVSVSAEAPAAPAAEALAVMEAFMSAFNARDEAAWADTLHFPHVRFASGAVTLYADRAAFLAGVDLGAFAADSGWDHSAWDDLQVIQSGPDKVHVAVNFTRYDAEGGVIGSFASLYVLEDVDGRWGVRARSSFAP